MIRRGGDRRHATIIICKATWSLLLMWMAILSLLATAAATATASPNKFTKTKTATATAKTITRPSLHSFSSSTWSSSSAWSNPLLLVKSASRNSAQVMTNRHDDDDTHSDEAESINTVATTTASPNSWFPPRCARRRNAFSSSSLLSSSSSTTWNDLVPRGGASVNDDEDDEEEEESDAFDDEDDDFLFDLDEADDDDMMVAESDFNEDNTLERMVDAFVKTPPFTKMYLTCSFLATLYGYVCNKNQFPKFLLLEWKPTLRRLQLWRPFTAFLNIGPFGLSYFLTAHFVWNYMATLERLNHKAPYDFWLMMVFGQLAMVAGYPLLRLNAKFLGHNLSTFLVYIWARYHEGIEVNLFELFNTRAELLPWFFLAQTFLLEGEPPVLDFLGIVFGHLYHYAKTAGMLRAPAALVRWYHSDTSRWATAIRRQYKEISSDFEMI